MVDASLHISPRNVVIVDAICFRLNLPCSVNDRCFELDILDQSLYNKARTQYMEIFLATIDRLDFERLVSQVAMTLT